MLIFGSVAIKHWFPDFPREPKGLDIISNNPFEEDVVKHYWIPEFQYLLDNNKDEGYLDPDFLFTLKLWRMHADQDKNKTIHDIEFLRKKGCEIDHGFHRTLMIKN